MANALNIIARKPRNDEGTDYIVVDRGPGHAHPFVVASANAHSLASGEWFWGHYFKTRDEALDAFDRIGRS